MDGDTLCQLNQIIRELRKIIYSVKKPEFMLFDLESTLLDTYGNQEGEGFNCHYQAHGYHPLLCCDGLTGDLLKAQLRDGTMYCGKEADIFMKSLLDEFLCDFPDMPLYFRGAASSGIGVDSVTWMEKLVDTVYRIGTRY